MGRDAVLLAAFGSPDPRQIDGLGGSYSTTSKAAIIAPGRRSDVDVNYTFAQVSVMEPLVDYQGNCGNISSAVGAFAIDEGLIPAQEPLTTVRILNTNTNKIIEAEVPVVAGKAAVLGDCQIDGVPGTGAPIRLGFVDPGGSVTGKLLPTGNPVDKLDIPGFGTIDTSLVDAANPAVFVRAQDVGMTGTETAVAIDEQPQLLTLLEAIRSVAAEAMSLARSPAIPKMAVVAPAMTYLAANDEKIGAKDVDMVARIMSMQRAHRAYALTGAIATAAASVIPETLVAESAGQVGQRPISQFRLGHPAGTMMLEVVSAQENGRIHLQKVIAEANGQAPDGWICVCGGASSIVHIAYSVLRKVRLIRSMK